MTKNYSNFRDRNAFTSLQNEAICQNGTEKAYYYTSTSVQNLVNKIIRYQTVEMTKYEIIKLY